MPTDVSVLVTGGAGLLGTALLRSAGPGVELHATMHEQAPEPSLIGRRGVHPVDLTDAEATSAVVAGIRPDVVIHTAYRRVDGEQHIVAATDHVARAAADCGARLIHVSSDVVFDGEHAPYSEASVASPVSEYGRHKLAAEEIVANVAPGSAVVRTSLIVGTEPLDPVTTWLVDTVRSGAEVTLYDDEWRCPIGVDDLAAMLWELVALPGPAGEGVWHFVGPEPLTRVELGHRLARRFGLDPAPLLAVPSPRPSQGDDGRPRDLRLTDERARAAIRHRPRPVP